VVQPELLHFAPPIGETGIPIEVRVLSVEELGTL
jgi:hypothetical protein